MKKSDFISLVIGVAGVLLFGVGMCMCLLPECNAFDQGLVVAAIGAVILLVLAIVSYVRSGKKSKINWRLTGKVLFGTVGALVLGLGMCMIMVWNRCSRGS